MLVSNKVLPEPCRPSVTTRKVGISAASAATSADRFTFLRRYINLITSVTPNTTTRTSTPPSTIHHLLIHQKHPVVGTDASGPHLIQGSGGVTRSEGVLR